LTLNGIVFYAGALLLDRSPSEPMRATAWLLFTLAPFSMLEPLGYLSETAEYSRKFDWFYLAFALGIVLASHARQRKSFYYAGLLNAGVGLYLIADHQKWFDKPLWAIALIVTGLLVLVSGFVLDRWQRTPS
jgi:peptidoglycan/LPS O-acetylase OafA/YrhL